uniref:Uncharacterized protein n=1 Tax=Eutreptiella gymnastica TaxID=73025 RepID=A0A7S1I280_9EUGL
MVAGFTMIMLDIRFHNKTSSKIVLLEQVVGFGCAVGCGDMALAPGRAIVLMPKGSQIARYGSLTWQCPAECADAYHGRNLPSRMGSSSSSGSAANIWRGHAYFL